jgi:hypothetical protein
MDAKMLSDRIRMKRKKVKEDGVENMIDTGPAPQMNPQDVWNLEKKAQLEEIPGADEIGTGPSDPTMEEPQKDDSQNLAVLKKHMERIRKILGRMSMSN